MIRAALTGMAFAVALGFLPQEAAAQRSADDFFSHIGEVNERIERRRISRERQRLREERRRETGNRPARAETGGAQRGGQRAQNGSSRDDARQGGQRRPSGATRQDRRENARNDDRRRPDGAREQRRRDQAREERRRREARQERRDRQRREARFDRRLDSLLGGNMDRYQWRRSANRSGSWRARYYEPPYRRSAHRRWGHHHYSPGWGWFFTAPLAGSTLVFVDELPYDRGCDAITYRGEQFHNCGDVTYRPVRYDRQIVYEIISDDPGQNGRAQVSRYDSEREAEYGATIGDEEPYFREIALTAPYTRGERVRQLQRALRRTGHYTSSIDGVFGPGTERSVRNFQQSRGLRATGVVDRVTAERLNL